MSASPERQDPEIVPVALKDALGERYLAYALSTITSRSLPDVRDGLKPVQRRLLYAMMQLRLDPASGYKKCARVVGDVIGKFHPHGDTAVYDALVRLAQGFSQRYPLVDGQGNFGNVDGDNPAAMRYTESRMTAVAQALLDGIDQDTVDFRETYDGSEKEPVVLPAAFPNLLANGATGIAVGMATSIPPHNAGELLDALAFMLERPADAGPATTAELMRFVRGPDLPTGGTLIESAATIAEAYETGRGSLRLRAHYEEEKLGHGQYQVVVTEIPYQVQKSRLIERLAELLAARKLPLLADLRDESTEDIRIVLIPRSRSVPAELLMEQLFRQSEMEVRLSLNMNVLDGRGVPGVLGLARMLAAFIDHRMEVLVRRSNFRLGKIEDRLEILDGYLKAYLDIDEVIRIIRESDEPKPELMARFELSERQAEAVLNLRLRNLRKLEEMELKNEKKALIAERRELRALLGDEGLRRAKLKSEMEEARVAFADPRRTRIAEAPAIDPVLLEQPVERVAMTVICSKKGWIRALRGHQADTSDIRYKDGDGERFIIHTNSADRLLAIADDGRVYLLAVDKLPSGRGMGEPVSLIIDLGKGVDLLALLIHDPAGKVIFATRDGRGFLAEEKEIAAQTRSGKQVVNLGKGDALVAARSVGEGADSVATVGTNRKLLVFDMEELPVMARGRGVILQRFRDAYLSDVTVLRLEDGLSWPTGSRTRHERDLTAWRGKRASAGRMAPQGFPRSHKFEEPGET
ncbi:MAG: DNA topoisomerase IV subunit A [Geminicoccaceae bacterium]|nr:DNA topoisomerase IV subunit A [Geminicoccaceae bacterium]